jgi:putative effector of murein hydrolase
MLAVPLYKQVESLKKNFSQIMVGIVSECTASIMSIYLLSKLFKLDKALELSLLPKSITTAVGIELSKQIGGIPSMTVTAIVITGILGAIIGPLVCKVSKITDEIAVGIALGTSSHALGTTKAIELGEVQGAMSGLAIGTSALVTVIITTIFIRFI